MVRRIDLETFPRRAHFAYFSSMANPYVGTTVQVDITDFLQRVKQRKLNFFLSFLFCVGNAANDVPELRQRILEGQPVEYDTCPTSHTVLCDNGTYAYCDLPVWEDFEAYLPMAQQKHQQAKLAARMEDGEDALSLLFISCLPWVSYTALTQPTPFPADSNPRITWGKYTRQGDRVLIPVTLLAHHALVDGMHIGAFYDRLGERLARF